MHPAISGTWHGPNYGQLRIRSVAQRALWSRRHIGGCTVFELAVEGLILVLGVGSLALLARDRFKRI